VSNLLPSFREKILSRLSNFKVNSLKYIPEHASIDEDLLFGLATHLNPTVVYLCEEIERVDS
jgi:hypothetical protein